jgi:hypothetical protein
MKKEPDDRAKLKIASFRTTDGDWYDFSQAAESNGLTATDVLKACMVEYLAGTYSPAINTPVSMRIQSAQGLTAEEVESIVKNAIESLPSNGMKPGMTSEGVQEIVDEAIQLLQATGMGSDVPSDILARLEAMEKAIENMTIKPKATRKATTEEPDPEVIKLANRLKADTNGLQAAVRAGIAKGLEGKVLCEFLFEQGQGANDCTNPFHSSVAGRFIKAIAYLDKPGTAPETPAEGDS